MKSVFNGTISFGLVNVPIKRERAAILTGRASYFDPVSGMQYREADLSNDYYATNHGEAWPRWIQNRIKNGSLLMTVQAESA